MAKFGSVLLVMVILSACGRQPYMVDTLPQQVPKQCLDTAQDIADCK